MSEPPGNSLDPAQAPYVAEPGTDLAEGLQSLLARITDEIEFNLAKGSSPYRLGVHDGLRFTEDAVGELLRRHGYAAEERPREQDA